MWPQSVRTLDAFLCMQIKSCLPFSNSNPELRPAGIIMNAIARDRMKNWEAIADNSQQGRLELGLAFDSEGRTSWIATTLTATMETVCGTRG